MEIDRSKGGREERRWGRKVRGRGGEGREARGRRKGLQRKKEGNL